MLRCARCGVENPAGFHVCGGCGIAGLLTLRGRALAGEPGAEARLEGEAARLRAPGALIAMALPRRPAAR